MGTFVPVAVRAGYLTNILKNKATDITSIVLINLGSVPQSYFGHGAAVSSMAWHCYFGKSSFYVAEKYDTALTEQSRAMKLLQALPSF